VQCWDAFTKNSDWVRRADLFEKEADEENSCSRFDVWLMLAEELVGRRSWHRSHEVIVSREIAVAVACGLPLNDQSKNHRLALRRFPALPVLSGIHTFSPQFPG
jgi:hypothetical protein